MAVSKNPGKVTVEDLSNLKELQNFPSYNSSMAGGNTVTDKDPNFAGQGIPSETTEDVTAHNVSYVGQSHDTVELTAEKTPEGDVSTDEKSTGYTPSARAWKEL